MLKPRYIEKLYTFFCYVMNFNMELLIAEDASKKLYVHSTKVKKNKTKISALMELTGDF